MVLIGGVRRKRRVGGSKRAAPKKRVVKRGGSKRVAKKSAAKNPWIAHIKKFAKDHPRVRGGELFAKARKTYKKKK